MASIHASVDELLGSHAQGHRKFYKIDSTSALQESTDPAHVKSDIFKYIADNVIGKDKEFTGPFGKRKVIYCDYTASGRSLKFLEEYINNEVLSDYGNTHTTTSVSSQQTTLFRHEARDVIRNALGASEHDSVVFVGSGCTGAVHQLLHAMDLQEPPVVFVGPYGHHSSLLPWRELGSTICRVRETSDGNLDIEHLENLMKVFQDSDRQLIGVFAAASNVTGTLVDVNTVTATLHRHGALAFWDYATAGPYVHIDMNPVMSGMSPDLVAKDAVFLSPHKFVGGVQTPGVLVAKKKLFKNPVPYVTGGGSVFFVRRSGHRYLQEAEQREEAGTPAIVESVRAGLVFQLKEAVGAAVIMEREDALVSRAFDCWRPVTPLIVLGSDTAARLPVFSFVVKHPQTGLLLHHNFVAALLNDLFGIQARGGCACAGPYAEDLLGMDENLAARYEQLLLECSQLDRKHLRRYRECSHREVLRPGFARLNLPYFVDDLTVDFILEAVKIVAEDGWKLMPQYVFDPETGEWRHKDQQVFKERTWLGHISYKTGHMTYNHPAKVKGSERSGPAPENHQECLKAARDIIIRAAKLRVNIPDQVVMFDDEAAPYRWFLLPSEAYRSLHEPTNQAQNSHPLPFCPVTYPRTVDDRDLQFFIEDFSKNLRGDVSEKGETNAAEPGNVTKGSPGTKGKVVEICKNCQTKGDGKSAESSSVSDNKMSKPSESSEPEYAGAASMADPDLHSKSNQQISAKVKDDVTNDAPSNIERPDQSLSGQSMECQLRPRKEKIKDDVPVTGHKWHSPPKVIFKPFVQALEELDMIKAGDRVLVCLSGGKDSLSLLHSLHQYQFYAKKKGVMFDLGAVTIDPQTAAYDPSPLKGYLKVLGVPYFYEEQGIVDAAQNLPYECASICSFCSRMKRGRIYHTARREKYNVLALGQHLDDLAESFLMSMFHNGVLRTMKACYTVQDGDLRVIRPFVYVRETEIRRFAEQSALPVIPENCPACFEAPKERHRMKQLLASQEIIHPRLFPSILSAIKPVFSIDKTGVDVRDLMQQFVGGQEDEQDIDEV